MDILQVKLEGEAWVEVDAMQGMSLSAKVTHISPTATIQSGVVNYEVKVEIESLEAVVTQRQEARQQAMADIAAGELPAPLQQAIDEGRLTREQAEEIIKQGPPPGMTPPPGMEIPPGMEGPAGQEAPAVADLGGEPFAAALTRLVVALRVPAGDADAALATPVQTAKADHPKETGTPVIARQRLLDRHPVGIDQLDDHGRRASRAQQFRPAQPILFPTRHAHKSCTHPLYTEGLRHAAPGHATPSSHWSHGYPTCTTSVARSGC